MGPRPIGEGWRDLIRTNGDAWRRIETDPSAPADDLYGGRLGDLRVPTLVIHGARDPRTEPGELEALRDALTRRAEALRHFAVLPEGGHSPHSERATSDAVTLAAERFLGELAVEAGARNVAQGSEVAHGSGVARASGKAIQGSGEVAQGFSPAKT